MSPRPHGTGTPHVALIGPVLPFRGGIAQYTTQLRRALATKCELRTISYRRQYPAWLYPGKSDREPDRAAYHEPGVDYTLDCLNPLSWRQVVHAITARRCTLAVFDWWTLFWAPAIALMAWGLRRRGVNVVFVCHNLFDHDSGWTKRRIAEWLLLPADAYVVHSTEQANTLRSVFPRKTVVVHTLPTYTQYPSPTSTPAKRGRLELLFFGFIRPYKGLDVLIDALAQLADSEVYLTVAGEPWCGADELRARIAKRGAPNIELHLDYVNAQTAANFFSRADLIVLPYLTASGSAVASMAFHYGRPLLATRTGAFPDVIDDGKTGFLVSPGSAPELAECIRTATREQLTNMRTDVFAQAARFTWDSLAEALLQLPVEPNVR